MFKNKLIVKLRNIYRRHYSNSFSIAKILQSKNPGDSVQIQGWIKSIRKMKENLFFDVSDGSCDRGLQVVIPNKLKSENLSTGCSVVASGNLNSTLRGHLELCANQLEVLGECVISEGYPFFPKKTYPPDYIRQYLHLRPRTDNFASLLRLRDAVNLAIHEYLHSEGYINVHTPILTSNDCEGAGEVFTVSAENKNTLKHMAKSGVPPDEAFFNSKVFLTVSGQLQLEAAAHGISKVYNLGPTFRAENSRSRLHLAEFYMLEAEIAFIDNLEELCRIIEKLIKTVISMILDKRSEVLIGWQNDLSWIDKKFHIITYDDAVSILDQNRNQFSGQYAQGFSKEHEIYLVKHFGEVPIFVVNWPKAIKPFYMKECVDDQSKKKIRHTLMVESNIAAIGKTKVGYCTYVLQNPVTLKNFEVAALDLLAPTIGEIVGGSLRENDYAKLKEKLPEGKTNLDWYLELRKYGSVPTGGFGLGFERLLQLISGITNIKDTIPFPRWPHNCSM